MDQLTRSLLGILNYIPGKCPPKELDYALRIIERAKSVSDMEAKILSSLYVSGELPKTDLNFKVVLNLFRDRFVAKACRFNKPDFWVITPKGLLLHQAVKAYLDHIEELENR